MELAAPAMENEADRRNVRREIEYRELNMKSKLADLRHCISERDIKAQVYLPPVTSAKGGAAALTVWG